jgi:hypothetical protein
MEIDTQTKKNKLSLKVTTSEVQIKFQDSKMAAAAMLEIEVNAVKRAITT